MDEQDRNFANRNKNDNFGDDKTLQCDGASVPPKERERLVLEFLDEHGIPLPPKAIYRGLKVERNITFSYRTVQNILKRLSEDGHVMRVDKDELDNGRIRPLPEDKNARRTYYFITDDGRERIGRPP